MESTTKNIFYVLREKSEDPAKDFPDLVYHLRNSYIFVDIVEESPDSVALSGAATYRSELQNLSANRPPQFSGYTFCVQLSISKEDYQTFGKLRKFLSRLPDRYRVYSQQLHCYLPEDIDLVSLEFGSVNIKTFEALKRYSLLPIYFSQENQVYYALGLTDGSVHLVNPHLLEYVYDKVIPEAKLPELSYPVATDLNHFSAMYDKELVPFHFYEYYGRSTKIINYSFFDIQRPDRKVFIKPYIFEFRVESGRFYTYAGPDGGSLLAMDKIRPGETLDQAITRILSVDLKISPDYLAALVSRHIEFDRDKEGILTPRLVVYVYVDKINDPKWALQMSQTGWRSTGSQIPNITPNPEFNKIKG